MRLERGDKVRFIGATDDQVQWGNNDDPRKVCEIGAEYVLDDVEVHSWHTNYYLLGIEGKFNSVVFEYVPDYPWSVSDA